MGCALASLVEIDVEGVILDTVIFLYQGLELSLNLTEFTVYELGRPSQRKVI